MCHSARACARHVPGLFFVASLGAACIGPPARTAPNMAESSAPSAAENAPSSSLPAIPYEWKSVVVLGGGYVTGLVYSPVQPGILYARTDIGGAYRYDPADQSWIPLTDFLGKDRAHYYGIESIAADPVDADRVYMAVGLYTQEWAHPGAFMRSTDRGNNWEIFPSPVLKMGGNEDGRTHGERLAIDPNQTGTLYFGSRRNGLWKSVDRAATFEKVDSFPIHDDPKGLGIPFVVFDARSGERGKPTPVIYVGSTRLDVGLYRSTDAGKTWKPVPNQPAGLMPSHAELDRNGVMYLSYGSGPGPSNVPDGAVWRYEPNAERWTNITPLQQTEGDRFGYGAVAVDPSRPGTLLASTLDRWSRGGEVFRTTDGGKTWKPLMAKAVLDAGGAAHIYYHKDKIDAPQWVGDIAIDPFRSDSARLITGGGVWASDNVTEADADRPTRWTFSNKNLEETAAWDMVSPPAGPPLLTAMLDLCGFRHDRLDVSPSLGTFKDPICASSSAIDFAESVPNRVVRVGSYPWAGEKGPRGAVSSDAGVTWQQFRSEPPGSNGSGTVAISADGKVILWAAKDAPAAFSTDLGETWKVAAGLPKPSKVPDWAPLNMRVAADRVNPRKFYVFDAFAGQAFTSEDGGLSFRPAEQSIEALPEYELTVASIQAAPGFEGDVWITHGNALLRSRDAGKTYAPIRAVEEAHAVGFGRAAPGKTFPSVYLSGKVGGINGFFRSDDAGETFARVNDDAHQYGGSSLISGDPRVFGRVYVAGHGRGILYGEPKR